MSLRGIEKVADIFTQMQQLRIWLLKNVSDTENVQLGQMLERGKDAMKREFAEITARHK